MLEYNNHCSNQKEPAHRRHAQVLKREGGNSTIASGAVEMTKDADENTVGKRKGKERA
tara:strand:+ start:855 stop:1028 length:174 start_codon:yes stop_codon:yes gene_type:complete